MSLVTTWWVWVAGAAVLGIVEILSPSFIALGFAMGALGVAGLLGLGIAPTPTFLFAIFATLSLVSWIVLRQLFKLPTGQVKTFDHDINE